MANEAEHGSRTRCFLDFPRLRIDDACPLNPHPFLQLIFATSSGGTKAWKQMLGSKCGSTSYWGGIL
jgi:hypothetical protein